MQECRSSEQGKSGEATRGQGVSPARKRKRLVVLSHWSALWYYRLSRIGLALVPYECEESSLADATANLGYLTSKDESLLMVSTAEFAASSIFVVEDVEKARRELGNEYQMAALSVATEVPYMIVPPDELDVLVGKGTKRPGPKARAKAGNAAFTGAHAHQCGYDLPAGSIRRIGATLDIVSPALMFVQLARELGEPHKVAALATELAGTYSLLPEGMTCCEKILKKGKPAFDEHGWLQGDGYRDALPLVTIDELREYVNEAGRMPGVNAAKRGLRASVDNSASPVETPIDVSLALPRPWGGAGCGLPDANSEIPLTGEGKKLTGKKHVRPDLLYVNKKGQRIDIEPGGSEWHSGKDAMTSDNDRRLALEHKGVEVIVVPWETFKDEGKWMHICRRVQRHLGKNYHAPSARMMARWRRVHQDLCNTNLLKQRPRRR